jgi:hypothetical protein
MQRGELKIIVLQTAQKGLRDKARENRAANIFYTLSILKYNEAARRRFRRRI